MDKSPTRNVRTLIQNFFLLLVGGSLLLNCSSEPPPSHSFSVMSWNIWHGGLHGSQTDGFEKDSSNTVNVTKVLQEAGADVVLMQETYCCGMDIARAAGYPYSTRGSSNLSIHSKFPILDSIEIFKPFHSHAAIIDVSGTPMLFVNVWLHYLPDFFQDIKTLSPDALIANESDTRLSEVTSILSALDSLPLDPDMPIIMGGDFNSGSHLDWGPSTAAHHYGKIVEWPVSKRMLDHGYKDSFRAAHPDPTKTLEGTWGFLNDDIISDRIDYVYFKGGDLKSTFSKIVLEDPEGGFFNSDHRAIFSIFEN
ncbi:MAG: endonuclease/exonuclease/phosphatase family protein [Saprospiraceae bacterium]|nr:endonuclease/exonuclease/phosphatase family protein [Saprospiraceae bacterium]